MVPTPRDGSCWRLRTGARSPTFRSTSERSPEDRRITGRDPRSPPGRRSPVRSLSSGSIAPLRRPARRRVRMRSSRSSGTARVATPSASVLAVPPGPDGFLRSRSSRIVRRAAGLLRPAAGHGVRQVSGSGSDSAQVVVAGTLPAGAHPSKRSPPRWPHDRHRRPCSRGMGVHRSASIHRRVRSALATFPSEDSRCSPGLSGMQSGVAPAGAFPLALIEPTATRSRQRARPWTCPLGEGPAPEPRTTLHLPCH